MSDARPEIPAFLAHLPVFKGLPVPWVASWSSEGLTVVRADPVVDGAVACFTKGRQGRGRPVFGVMNSERQRRAVMHGLCQVCGDELHGPGFLPNHPTLVETVDNRGGQYLIEPPCCEPCARWAVLGCPGLRGRATDILQINELQPFLQLIDVRDFVARKAERFDQEETPETRRRLDGMARRYPDGVVGYVRYQVLDDEKLPL